MVDEKSLAAEIRRELDAIKKDLDEGLEANDLAVLEEKVKSSTCILEELSNFCGEVIGPDKKMQMSVNIYLKDVISLWKKKFWSIDIVGTSEASLEITCSKMMFKRAIENLILNSMEAGASKVNINVTAQGIIITDNGSGISAEDSKEIKQRGTTKENGRGYGLKIVREFLNPLGWSLHLANNKEDQGLVVTMKKGVA